LWVERAADGLSARDARAFDQWSRDVENAAAFNRIRNGRGEIERLAADHDFRVLRRETQARLGLRASQRARSRWLGAIAASVLIATPVTIVALRRGDTARSIVPAAQQRIVSTTIGQRLAMTLSDGSRLTLDTDSQVRIDYSPTERRLHLERGDAMFEVAKGKSRPFIVTAGNQVVTAHGTAFDIRLTPDKVRVVLMEGKVTVASPSGTVAMLPDDVLTARQGHVTLRRRAISAEMTSWQQGFLTFDDRPLSEAVAEVNRYLPERLMLANAEVGHLRISGAFRTNDIDAFVDALEAGFPVRVTTSADGSRVIESVAEKN
jgi:transmembrane sensor